MVFNKGRALSLNKFQGKELRVLFFKRRIVINKLVLTLGQAAPIKLGIE